MKHLIIYHANCMDGFGAAWAAYTGIRDNVNSDIEFRSECDEIQLWPANYGEPWPQEEIAISTQIHIVDFSYDPKDTRCICDDSHSVVLLDHHKSAIDKFNVAWNLKSIPENMTLILDDSKSGAMLAWEYYHPNESVPNLIRHIQDRDLWKFEMMNTKAFHLNLSTFPKEIQVWTDINDAIESSYNSIVPDNNYYDKFICCGNAIDRYYQQTIQSIIESGKVEFTIDGIKGLACNCNGMFASDIGNILAKESGTYGLTWNEDNKKQEKISLRSIGEFDVAKIAESFGGGGHKNAAGFSVSVKDIGARIKFKML